jgi:hypothetical protein
MTTSFQACLTHYRIFSTFGNVAVKFSVTRDHDWAGFGRMPIDHVVAASHAIESSAVGLEKFDDLPVFQE